MKVNFTDEQKQAVVSTGDSLIVSAAAGSGKTAVLSERVAELLCDAERPVSPDSVMVLTFTDAAAAQMRRRITDKLRDRAAAEPDNAYVRAQLLSLPAARIGTIHSACFDLIRKNFEALDVDPQFSVADENVAAAVREQVLDDFIEELYGRAETDRDVDAFISAMERGRDENTLLTTLEAVCGFLENEPFPGRFVKRLSEPCGDEPFSLFPPQYFALPLERGLEHVSQLARKLIELACDEGDEEHYANDKWRETYAAELEGVNAVLEAVRQRDYDKAYERARGLSFVTHRGPKANTPLRNGYKKEFEQLRAQYLGADGKQTVADRAAELALARRAAELALEFTARLEERFKELRLITFSGAERYALRLLVNDDGSRTELAKKLSDGISEIIVDEAQDCSRIQDCIFGALSRNNKNLFKVGDVKQSIYCFRSAFPKLFTDLLGGSERAEGRTLTAPSRIDLAHNFRSHPKVLAFVNRIFSGLMTDGRGGIDYADGHELRNGGLYDGVDLSEVKLTLLLDDGAELAGSRREAEAELVAERISGIIGKLDIYDAGLGAVRKARASDVALLLRTPNSNGRVYEDALHRRGVGCVNSNKGASCLETRHVRDLLAYLGTIDDPYDDVRLITLLHSAYCGYTAADLGRVRAAKRGVSFYEALCEYAKSDRRSAEFLKELDTLRALSQVSTVYELINILFERSGVLLRTAAQPDGDAVRGDLMMIAELAAQFESTRYRGLFAFLEYIAKKAENGADLPAAQSGGADCVCMMSIHKAKGLEFPIVFLADCAGAIVPHARAAVLCDAELGAGAYVRDGVRHREFEAPGYRVIKQKQWREALDEDMRLLYVALTRAATHLYMTAALKREDAEALIRDGVSDPYRTPTFLKWIIGFGGPVPDAFADLAGIPAGAALYGGEVVTVSDESDVSGQSEPQAQAVIPARRVDELLARKYPFETSVKVPAKLSVSEIKNAAYHTAYKVRPRFTAGSTGADRGNATHHFLQFCDFSRVTDRQSLESEIARLVTDEFITAREAELTDKERVLRFLTCERMKALGGTTVHKEQRFLFTLPAREVTELDSDEPVVVQGVIDCWYETPDGAVILDYKTDAVNEPGELIRRYGVQLELYEKALEQLYSVKVTHKLIYSFALEQFIEIK